MSVCVCMGVPYESKRELWCCVRRSYSLPNNIATFIATTFFGSVYISKTYQRFKRPIEC